jgi:hypothetical protein
MRLPARGFDELGERGAGGTAGAWPEFFAVLLPARAALAFRGELACATVQACAMSVWQAVRAAWDVPPCFSLSAGLRCRNSVRRPSVLFSSRGKLLAPRIDALFRRECKWVTNGIAASAALSKLGRQCKKACKDPASTRVSPSGVETASIGRSNRAVPYGPRVQQSDATI